MLFIVLSFSLLFFVSLCFLIVFLFCFRLFSFFFYYELGKKYLPDGTGSVFTFGVKGGYESGLKMLETVELFSHVANIGDTHSLILHPASTTHRQLSKEQLITAGAGPEVVRLSIGIECAEDLIADLDQALKRL